MNRFHLVHVTEFVYDGPVSESYNEVRLRPMHDETQSCLSFRLTTAPASPAFSYRDALGNWVHQVNILPVHSRLRVQAESVVLSHSVAAATSVMPMSELEAQREELV
jgi:transglutaminase-like putative cysteine protease